MKTIQRLYVYGNRTGVEYFSNTESIEAVLNYIEKIRLSDFDEYLALGVEWIKEGCEAVLNNMGATDISSYQNGIYKVNISDIDYSFKNERQNKRIKDIAEMVSKFV